MPLPRSSSKARRGPTRARGRSPSCAPRIRSPPVGSAWPSAPARTSSCPRKGCPCRDRARRRGADPLELAGARLLARLGFARLLLGPLGLLLQPGRVVALVRDALAAIEL